MRCEMVGKTDVGRQRLRNEDNFLLLEKFGVSVVADGMGGHVDGNIASQIAVDTIQDVYENDYLQLKSKNFSTVEEFIQAQENFIVEAVQKANQNIFSRNKGTFALEGMGTTVVVLQVGEGYVLTACVGDSRIYLFREQKLTQITQDHSLVGELVRYNIIDKKDMLFFQNKNIITRALGMADQVLVDITKQKAEVGDLFLLCSDGLTDLVPDEEIERILVQTSPDLVKSVDMLIDEANERGGKDNITVTLVKLLP